MVRETSGTKEPHLHPVRWSREQSNALPALALVVAIFAISTAAFFVRWSGAPGPVTTTYRMGLAMVIQMPFVLARSRRQPSRLMQSRPLFPALSGLAMGICLVLWSEAIPLTHVANASLLANSAPIFVALFAWFVLHERLPSIFWLGLGLALAGMALIVSMDFLLNPSLSRGNLLALASAVFYAVYYLLAARSRQTMSTFGTIWLINLSASALLGGYCLLARLPLAGYPPQTWLLFGLNALVPQLIGYSCATYALGRLPAWIVSPTMVLQPALTALLAVPLVKESLSPIQALGGAAVLLGVFLIHRSRAKPLRTSHA